MNPWDKRYDTEDYRYGTSPVNFLTESISDLAPGTALCIGAGEGRNAVWLAEQGWDVTALDLSRIGLDKAAKLAVSRGVSVKTVTADAVDWDMGMNTWDLVIIFFVHARPAERAAIHRNAALSLKADGRLILEGFTPRQFGTKTGGPGSKPPEGEAPLEDMLARFIEPEELRDQLPGLELSLLQELEIELDGGEMHNGPGFVVHCIGIKK